MISRTSRLIRIVSLICGDNINFGCIFVQNTIPWAGLAATGQCAVGDGELIVLSLSAGPSGSVFLWGRCISVMVQCATWRASAALFQAADGFGDVDEVVGDTLAVG